VHSDWVGGLGTLYHYYGDFDVQSRVKICKVVILGRVGVFTSLAVVACYYL
jgi:hypothetical protein